MSPTNDPFNPSPTYPFSPDQLEVFCFLGRHGFIGIGFDFVQGFMAAEEPETSWVFVECGNYHYESTEPVPVLTARYADMKRRRALSAPAPAPRPNDESPPVWKGKM